MKLVVKPGGEIDANVDQSNLDQSTDVEFGELEPVSPPLIDEQGRVRLSFSRMDTYRSCAAKFQYSYIDQLPGAPSPHLSFGSTIHAALEFFYARKLPEPPTQEELQQFLFDNWDSDGYEGMSRDEQVSYYRHAQNVLRRFHDREAPRFRLPADTEHWFEIPFADEAVVVGSIDRVDVDDAGRFEVIDYKTNRRAKSREDVRSSLQLGLYAIACEHEFGTLPDGVTLDFVVPGVSVRVSTSQLDLDAVRKAVADVARGVRESQFEPTPTRLCDWCDYRNICSAWTGEGPDVLGPAEVEAQSLRRKVTRDVRRLRELEAGVERIRSAQRLSDQPAEG